MPPAEWEWLADLTLDQAGNAEWTTPAAIPVSASWTASAYSAKVGGGSASGTVRSIAGVGLELEQTAAGGYNTISFPIALLGDPDGYEIAAAVVASVPDQYAGAGIYLGSDAAASSGLHIGHDQFGAIVAAATPVTPGASVDVTSEVADSGGAAAAHLAILVRRTPTNVHASFKVYTDVNPPGPDDVADHDLGDIPIDTSGEGDLRLLLVGGDPAISFFSGPVTWRILAVRLYRRLLDGSAGGGGGGDPGPVITPPSLRRRFRDAIRELSPPWLRGGLGEEILGAIAVQLDELTDRLVAGVRLRFPGLYGFASLPLIGRERRIRRGRLETDEVYVRRLGRWLDDHRRRGGAYALLGQLHAHYAPSAFPIVLRYASGRRYTMDAAGVVTRDVAAWAVPGGATPRWARWWLFYTWPDPVSDDGTWGDPGTWGDGGVWGSSLTPDEVRDLRLVPREWGAAHATGRIVLESPTMTISISVEGG